MKLTHPATRVTVVGVRLIGVIHESNANQAMDIIRMFFGIVLPFSIQDVSSIQTITGMEVIMDYIIAARAVSIRTVVFGECLHVFHRQYCS